MEKKDRLLGFFGDKFHKNVFLVCLITSIVLLLVSWVMPPAWVIDPSVLKGVAELFAFAALAEFGAAIDRGHSASISHGNTTVTISPEDEIPSPEEYEEEDRVQSEEEA